MGDEAGVAMAEALKHNATLQSFTINASDIMRDETWVAMASALEGAMEHNVTLQHLKVSGRPLAVGHLERNRVVMRTRQVLSSLARMSADTSFHSLVEKTFRRKVFAFFLPEICRFMPLEFRNGSKADRALHRAPAPAETFVAASCEQ